MIDKIRREPALVTGLVLAVIGVVSAFGLHVTDGQSAGIVSLVGAVLALFGAGVTRSQVTPAREVAVKRDPDTGRFVAAAGHAAKAGTVLGLPEPDGKDHV